MAEYLASIFGTEKDKVNCTFYFKIGACRHGDTCTRIHNRPTFSQTIVLVNMYKSPAVTNAILDPAGLGISPYSDNQLQDNFDTFFEDVFVEIEEEYGEIDEMNVCDNLGDHLMGNVYIKFVKEVSSKPCVQALNNRWYNGAPIRAELSPVTDFREACCRQYEMGECSRAGMTPIYLLTFALYSLSLSHSLLLSLPLSDSIFYTPNIYISAIVEKNPSPAAAISSGSGSSDSSPERKKHKKHKKKKKKHKANHKLSGRLYIIVNISLNVLLLVSCLVFILIKTVLKAVWWCVKTPILFCVYFCIGVKNFVVYGKAAPPPPGPGEEEGEEDGLFRRRPGTGSPPGPKREPGEGFTQDIPKTTEECVNHLVGNSNPYAIFCVHPDANQVDIKKSYRQMAILVHPDKTSHPGADGAFKVLGKAFETVGDPEKRQEFDSGLISPEEFAADVETMMTRLYEMYRDTLVGNSNPYAIFCVHPDANQVDIKKSYRQMAILVHPDKTSHPGADGAFKVLGKAFETVGDPEKRQEFDSGLISPEEFAADVETMMTRLYEMYRDTLPCGGCGKVHKITPISDKALTRHCSECNSDHPVKENDIWAETRYMGLYISYFACRNGTVYNVSDWIICQGIRVVPYTHQIQFALRGQNKTFDDILKEMEQDILGKAKKQQKQGQQQQQSAAGEQPTQSSVKRRNRKRKKK
eukprot:sb/3462630/